MKQIILSILDYLKNQVAEDRCTASELKSIYDAVVNNMDIDATAQDIAKHFDKNEANVRSVINRRYIGKPKRRVYYNFLKFIRIVPKTW